MLLPLLWAGEPKNVQGATGVRSCVGVGMPKLATGVAAGVMLWVPQVQVVTVDVGTLGVGVGTTPCLILQPLLLVGISAGFAAQGLVGPMSPLTILALANGLALAFPQGLIVTAHPTVGIGAGVCSFKGPSAVPSMIEGFATVDMTSGGAVKMATAIGMGLDTAFAASLIPTPIVGPPAPAPGGGTGTGKIL